MIENNNAAPDTRPRYAPPNQRSRSLSRRKSGDHSNSNSRSQNNSPSSSSFEGERERDNKHRPISRSSSTSSTTNTNDNIITIEGCSRSKAAQLISNRWSATIQAYNDPSLHPSELGVANISWSWLVSTSSEIKDQFQSGHGNHHVQRTCKDILEKPVLYSGGGASAWGNPRLSHQMDFLTELRRAIQDAKANPDA